jgi:tRNA(fMet)-specific endonuclease VapC
MNYLLDTNILLIYIRSRNAASKIDKTYQPLDLPNRSAISVVNLGEIHSISLQNQWGQTKINTMETFLQKFPVADINAHSIIQRYAEIEAFSQDKLPHLPLGLTARNMTKNDLWIAATASVLDMTLLTTDQDFRHLHGIFLTLKEIDINELL